MAEHKMSVNEAAAVFTALKNQYKAAERLEEACAVVQHLDAEVSHLKRERDAADDALALAVRDRAAAENDRKTAINARDKAIMAHKDALKAEADGLVRFQGECVKETNRMRAEHMEERKKILQETLALEAKRGNLAKAVRELEKPPGGPESSSSARVEP